MTQPVYGCHNRNDYPATYMTQTVDVWSSENDKYAIPHRMAKDCQFTKTTLGQGDPKCKGCKWRQEDNPTS